MAGRMRTREITVRLTIDVTDDSLTDHDLMDVVRWHLDVEGPDGDLTMSDIADPSAVKVRKAVLDAPSGTSRGAVEAWLDR